MTWLCRKSIMVQQQYGSSAVQCSAVQCSAVQCSAVQCSAVQCSVRRTPGLQVRAASPPSFHALCDSLTLTPGRSVYWWPVAGEDGAAILFPVRPVMSRSGIG